jgi:hypothetical protein
MKILFQPCPVASALIPTALMPHQRYHLFRIGAVSGTANAALALSEIMLCYYEFPLINLALQVHISVNAKLT